MLNSIEEHITILIYRSTNIFFCLYRPVAAGHFGPSSSGGLVALPLGALRLGAFFLRISFSDLKDVSSCVGRLKRVLFACSEKGVCRQHRSSPLCTSCIYRLCTTEKAYIEEDGPKCPAATKKMYVDLYIKIIYICIYIYIYILFFSAFLLRHAFFK